MDLSGDAAGGLKMRAPGNELGPVKGAAVAEAMANCTQLTSVVLYRMYCVPVLLLLWCVCLCVWLEFRAQDCGLVVAGSSIRWLDVDTHFASCVAVVRGRLVVCGVHQ